MGRLMHEGGMGMWFVLLFGMLALGGAILFARRPDENRLGVLRALSWTTWLGAMASFFAGAAKAMGGVGRLPPELLPRAGLMVMKGISEAMAALVLASALLALSWLVIAVGLRRLAAREG